MACFVVPGVEAIIVTAVTAAQKRKERKAAETHVEIPSAASLPEETPAKVSFSRKLSWLKYMLWGGVVLLAFEHVWHGEVVPFPPFLTALHSPADTATMLHEMATVGICMAALITGVWAVMCLVADAIAKRSNTSVENDSVG